MLVTRINWPLVHYKMAERKISSMSALARAARVHRNTLGRNGPFMSNTIDHLGHYFGCDPRELIMVEESDQSGEDAPPSTPPAPTRKRAVILLPAENADDDPAKAAVLEARRAALLEQAMKFSGQSPK